MDADAPFLTCAYCGDRLGVYEPLWRRQPDGTVAETSHRAETERRLARVPTEDLFHIGCIGRPHAAVN